MSEVRLRLATPLVKAIMKNPVTVKPSDTILDAVRAMARHRIGSVVVAVGDGCVKPVGIVTEKDVLRWVAEEKPLTEPVERIMTRDLITISDLATIFDAARAMSQAGIRHLVVVDRDGCLRGVFSERDIVAHMDLLKALAEIRFEEG